MSSTLTDVGERNPGHHQTPLDAYVYLSKALPEDRLSSRRVLASANPWVGNLDEGRLLYLSVLEQEPDNYRAKVGLLRAEVKLAARRAAEDGARPEFPKELFEKTLSECPEDIDSGEALFWKRFEY